MCPIASLAFFFPILAEVGKKKKRNVVCDYFFFSFAVRYFQAERDLVKVL